MPSNQPHPADMELPGDAPVSHAARRAEVIEREIPLPRIGAELKRLTEENAQLRAERDSTRHLPVMMTEERVDEIRSRLLSFEQTTAELRGQIDELRADRDSARAGYQTQIKQKLGLQARLAKALREVGVLRRFRYELTQAEPEDAKAASIAIAAKATLERDRAVTQADTSEWNLKQVREALSEANLALRDALEKLDAPECEECRGTGQHPPEEDCEDCGGVGLQWYPEAKS